jgi:hypothetical protein
VPFRTRQCIAALQEMPKAAFGAPGRVDSVPLAAYCWRRGSAMPRSPKPTESKYAMLTAERRAELDEIEVKAVINFTGQLDELEKAIGILRVGHQFGWKVLVLGHSKKTIRKYEEILGITFREFFPAEGPSAARSFGYSLAQKIDNFWKVVSGDIKIEDRSKISRNPIKGT